MEELIFDDPELMAQAFEQTFFNRADKEVKACTHKEIKRWSDGRGYCVECGNVFGADVAACDNGNGTLSNCAHEESCKTESGLVVCKNCGKEFEGFDFTQEWRYYGSSDNRTLHDPSRCHSQKSAPKGIDSVFLKKNIVISPMIKEAVSAKYEKIINFSGDNFTRGEGRISIAANCLFYVYYDNNEFRTSSKIHKMFGITQKKMSLGRTKYLETFPEDATKHITAEKLVPWLLKELGIEMKYYRRILAITNYLSSTSQLIERSNPQSIAAGIIYFYLCLDKELRTKLNLTRSEFAKKIDLTEITITKIVKEIAEVSKEIIELQ